MEIKKFTREKVVDYPEQQELYERLVALVHEYDDEMSLAASIGVVELVKDTLINNLIE